MSVEELRTVGVAQPEPIPADAAVVHLEERSIRDGDDRGAARRKQIDPLVVATACPRGEPVVSEGARAGERVDVGAARQSADGALCRLGRLGLRTFRGRRFSLLGGEAREALLLGANQRTKVGAGTGERLAAFRHLAAGRRLSGPHDLRLPRSAFSIFGELSAERLEPAAALPHRRDHRRV